MDTITTAAGTVSNTDTEVVLNKPGTTVLDVDETASTTFLSTSGYSDVPFRADYSNVSITSTDNIGKVLLSVPLDRYISETVGYNSDNFQFFQFNSLAISMKNISPFSTASGSVQFVLNPDPDNLLMTGDSVDAFDKAMRLMSSKQLACKDAVTATVNLADLFSPVEGAWRYCKADSTNTPRRSSFGQIAVVARGIPSAGDYCAWTVTITGSVRFNRPIKNTNVTSMSFYMNSQTAPEYSVDYFADGSSSLLLTMRLTDVPNTLDSTGLLTLHKPFYETIVLTDATDPTIKDVYQVSFSSCDYVCVGGNVDLFYPLLSTEPTDIVDVLSATVTGSTGASQLEGFCVFVDSSVRSNNLGLNPLSLPIAKNPQNTRNFRFNAAAYNFLSKKKYLNYLSLFNNSH